MEKIELCVVPHLLNVDARKGVTIVDSKFNPELFSSKPVFIFLTRRRNDLPRVKV